MTITAQDARDEYTATAGQTVFNYTFKIYADTDLDVYITPAGQDADDSADLTTAYTVDPSTIGDPDGGFITLDSGANSGDLVTIVSSMPYNRTVDYQNSGDFLPDTVNGDNDRQVSQIKQVADLAGRSPKYPNSLQNAVEQTVDVPTPLGYWRDKSDGTGVEKVDLSALGAPTDSSIITYNAGNNFTGGTTRSQENKNADLVSVLDFGAIGDDATDNITAINSAITHCLSSGDQLWWPSGTFFVGSNIANFHDVSHRGGGAVRRGTDTWYVEGVTDGSRSLYVQSNTGSDTNDGLDSSNPLATEQYAIDAMQAINNKGGEAGTLQLVTGHTIQSGIDIDSGDYGWITISSDDATVLVVGFTGRYIECLTATAPTLNTVVDGNNLLDRCYALTSSQGKILPSAGANNCTGRPLYANASIVDAGNTTWDGNGDIYATGGSGVQLGGSTVDNSTQVLGAIIASRGAAIEAQGIQMAGNLRCFFTKRAGSSINAHDATTDSCDGIAEAVWGSAISLNESVHTNVLGVTRDMAVCSSASLTLINASFTANAGHATDGIVATGGAQVSISGGTLTGAGRYGIESRDGSVVSGAGATIAGSGTRGAWSNQGGRISLDGGSVTGSPAGNDLVVTKGSYIDANGATTSSGVGPILADTNVAAFNTLDSNNGIIWN